MASEAVIHTQTLLVIYTHQLDQCRDFYSQVGLPLVREQHGDGPVHYAAELNGGMVIEFYPGKPDRTTGRLRLAFTVTGGDHAPGVHTLTDPDGRTVEVTVPSDVGPLTSS